MSKSELLYSNMRERFQNICDSGEIHLSNSEYEPLDACPQKGALFVLGRRVSSRGQIALIFGGAFHAAMELHLEGKPVDAQIDAALQYAQQRQMGLFEDKKRNYESLAQLVRMYNADYEMRSKRFEPVLLDDMLCIERTFELPLGVVHVIDTAGTMQRVSVFIRGKLDLLSFWNGKQVWVVDHKTTSIMGEQFTADKLRGSQFLIYVLGARRLLSGFHPDVDVHGCVVNAAVLRSKTFEFATFDLPFPEWQLVQFERHLLARVQSWLQDMSQGLQHDDDSSGLLIPDFPTSRVSCVTKYGKCPYYDVCQVHPTKMGDILYDDTLYKDETHSVETYG